MRRMSCFAVAVITAIASSAVAQAEIITLQSDTSEELMPLVDRLATAQIVSSVLMAGILGISMVICCIIMKRKG